MKIISSRALRHQRRHRKNRMQLDNRNEIGRLNMVFFTGAGLSAESGVPTFRGKSGLWYQSDNIRYSQVSSLEKNLTEFLIFHNRRRRSMLKACPSQAHYLMAELQQKYHVRIITQNIDDLHERAGSHSVTHLHGSIQFLVPKGFRHPKYRRPWCDDIYVGDCCPHTGSQLRPDVVLFGEKIYGYRQARRWLCEADIVVIIGTSLLVEPAHSLLGNTNPMAKVYYINPESHLSSDLPFPGEQIIDGANSGMSRLLGEISSCWQ
ncbi:Sir2 family NAD-dependent protein deacetylase [Aeromonas sp. CD]|uniref:SIR2 family NAD-dependent protein deacylase n=1 Tax=Aeromonas sp. CD TaxID=3080830 RepID=UPI0029667F03|nr:Sir2 family NAD-dependent protein deacetylase [Aeromonas sp. CD]WOX51432.1 Sir2 family NAD-dependent protein deacetylase [Aeromonas sp. CD]